MAGYAAASPARLYDALAMAVDVRETVQPRLVNKEPFSKKPVHTLVELALVEPAAVSTPAPRPAAVSAGRSKPTVALKGFKIKVKESSGMRHPTKAAPCQPSIRLVLGCKSTHG